MATCDQASLTPPSRHIDNEIRQVREGEFDPLLALEDGVVVHHPRNLRQSLERYPDDFFDGITFLRISHTLLNPEDTLEMVEKKLRPGGRLYASGSMRSDEFRTNMGVVSKRRVKDNSGLPYEGINIGFILLKR